MKKGFMDFAATRLVPEHPGQTAREYAVEYLQLGNDFSDSSDSKTPVESLANTLDKQVREGKEPRIKRERIGGVYRFFPASKPVDSNSLCEVVTQIKLSSEDLQDIDNLVAVEKFGNRNNAIKWLVIEGIKANRDFLSKVSDTKMKIEQLKKEIDIGAVK